MGNPQRSRVEAHLALAFLALCWGYSWLALKVATLDASPVAVAWGRCAGGAVALLVTVALTGRSLRPPPFVPTLIYGLLQTTGFHLVQTIAVSIGDTGKAAVLAYTMPFWLSILAWPFLGERIAGRRWFVLALAVAGLLLVVTPLRMTNALASLLPVLAGLLWAASAIWVIRIRAAGGYDLLSLTAWQMAWGSIALLPLTLVLPVTVRFTTGFVLSMAFLVVFSTALGWALWLVVLSRLPASVAGVASLATPVVAVLVAAVHLHEIPTRNELAGIACLVVALVVNTRVTARAAAQT
jgi:drug/metabolite transporter (DMT)-like permease